LLNVVMEGHAENRSDKNDLNAESQTFLNFKKSLFVTTRGWLNGWQFRFAKSIRGRPSEHRIEMAISGWI
jgi:hypothetical protein